MKAFSIFLLGLFLCSCSASWHLSRAIKKDPTITDTVVTTQVVYRTVQAVDTVFKTKIDTVRYYQDSVFVEYHYNFKDSTAYVNVDCPDCPEYTKTIQTTLTRYRTFPEHLAKFWWTYLILGVVLVLARLGIGRII